MLGRQGNDGPVHRPLTPPRHSGQTPQHRQHLQIGCIIILAPRQFLDPLEDPAQPVILDQRLNLQSGHALREHLVQLDQRGSCCDGLHLLQDRILLVLPLRFHLNLTIPVCLCQCVAARPENTVAS
ncbi:hypothetical protein D3C78_517520 [compost metagenome]